MSATAAISTLQQRIAERRLKRVANLVVISTKQHENDIIDAEVVAWEEAIALILNNATGADTSDAATDNAPPNNSSADQQDLRRGPRNAWKIVMPEMVQRYRNREFELNDVDATAHRVGNPMNPNTIRSQMANYAKSGVLERVRSGWYKFTDKGLTTFGSLWNAPNAYQHLDAETPAVDDVQAAGVAE